MFCRGWNVMDVTAGFKHGAWHLVRLVRFLRSKYLNQSDRKILQRANQSVTTDQSWFLQREFLQWCAFIPYMSVSQIKVQFTVIYYYVFRPFYYHHYIIIWKGLYFSLKHQGDSESAVIITLGDDWGQMEWCSWPGMLLRGQVSLSVGTVMAALCLALTMTVMITGRPSSHMNSQRSCGWHRHLAQV